MHTHIHLDREGDIAQIVLSCDDNKPTTLDHIVLDELEAALGQILETKDTLRVVILRSANPRYFCVGANVNALQTLDPGSIVPWVEHGHRVLNLLQDLPLPTIARVEGYALGGGLELAMACDLILTGSDAQLGQPEANLGLVPGWGGSSRLSQRIGAARAKEMFFTGKIIDAATANSWRLVDFVGSQAALKAYQSRLLDGIRQCSAMAVAEVKALINAAESATIEENGRMEALASSRCLSHPDTQQRVSTYLASRKKRS